MCVYLPPPTSQDGGGGLFPWIPLNVLKFIQNTSKYLGRNEFVYMKLSASQVYSQSLRNLTACEYFRFKLVPECWWCSMNELKLSCPIVFATTSDWPYSDLLWRFARNYCYKEDKNHSSIRIMRKDRTWTKTCACDNKGGFPLKDIQLKEKDLDLAVVDKRS